MTKLWNSIKNGWQFTNRSNEKTWQSYYEDEPDYTWLKKTIAAMALFALVYGAQVSNTQVGLELAGGVRQMLVTQTDFAYYTMQAIDYVTSHWPNAASSPVIPVLKQVQTTISRPADPLRYMMKPVAGQIVTPYGWQTSQAPKQAILHEGIAIAAPEGSGVQAAAAGKVKAVTDSVRLGRMLIIEHGQGIETVYGYLGEVLVKEGEPVSQGQVMAYIGKGGPAMAELYFELRENGRAVDPLSRIKEETVK
ncbi:MAG: Peptidase family [Firmicutes bacterium]|nr:Peptidase family [Bacillota bacterium]